MYSGVREDVAFIGRVPRGIGYIELIVNVPSSLRSSMVLKDVRVADKVFPY